MNPAGLLALKSLFLALSGFAFSEKLEDFSAWTALYGKFYNPRELTYRESVYEQNLRRIAIHNEGNSNFKLAINEFADLTPEEFKQNYLGYNGADTNRTARQGFSHENVTPPPTKDWRKEGAVTEVKNQLFCGSCWAYSAVGAVEGVNYLYSKELVTLSEQQLVDCDTRKDQGCSGGLMDYAFKYIISNGGLDTEEDYFYISIDETCNKLRESRTVVSIDSYEDVPPNSESSLEKAVAAQPVSVAICASDLQFYSSGIVDSCCTELDHGVLAVGYGEEKGEKFWLVKNSWGAGWGEKGYFRLRKEVAAPAGTCHIAQAPSYPLKSSANPANPPQVCGFFGSTECPHGSSCACTYSLLDLICLQWGCGPPEPQAVVAS